MSLFAFLPLLPVRGIGRGREKRAGVMRVLGGGLGGVHFEEPLASSPDTL
jgi:hypothetical protein